MRCEFRAYVWSKKFEGFAVAVVGVKDCEFFFLWVEVYTVYVAPDVDVALAVV